MPPPTNINHDVTHEADALGHLISQYENADNLRAIIKAAADEIQAAEDSNWQLYTLLALQTAIGHQLDRIGVILGLPRPSGDADTLYRALLFEEIVALNSEGTPEELISVYSFFTQSLKLWYFEPYIGYFFMQVLVNLYSDLLLPADTIYRAIFNGRCVGVDFALVASMPGDFGFLEDADSSTFGDINDATVGGNQSILVV